MEQNFKYPLHRMFFDSGKVACVIVEDLVKEYPELKDKFENKSWEITRLKPIKEDIIVMAVRDAEDIINEAYPQD